MYTCTISYGSDGMVHRCQWLDRWEARHCHQHSLTHIWRHEGRKEGRDCLLPGGRHEAWWKQYWGKDTCENFNAHLIFWQPPSAASLAP